mgnify:CR=1 FL=1
MSDTTRHDHLTLLLSDAERALDGLQLSLSQPLQDMPQAALHAMDLVTSLSRLGLASQADVVQAMAQQLSLGHPSVWSLAQDIIHDLQPLLQEYSQSDARIENTEPSSLWSEWRHRLNAPSPAPSPPPAWGSLSASRPSPTLTGYGALSTESTSANPMRQHGLDLLQHARMLSARSDERSRRALDAVLAELQDRTCRLDQVPLRNLYNQGHHHVDDAWADLDIVRGLQQLQPLALRSRSIRVESRGLLVFIDWSGLELTSQELQSAGKTLNPLGGSVMERPDGYRICLPCSLRRMSCMAFQMAGQRYAVSAAQCPAAPVVLGPDAPGDLSLTLQLGDQSLTLQPEAWLGCHPMNVYPIPPGVTAPAGVSSVALDGYGRVFLWFDRLG